MDQSPVAMCMLLSSHPHLNPPSPPSHSSHPSHPCSLPADCSISQIIKDDYGLTFYNIIILWSEFCKYSLTSSLSLWILLYTRLHDDMHFCRKGSERNQVRHFAGNFPYSRTNLQFQDSTNQVLTPTHNWLRYSEYWVTENKKLNSVNEATQKGFVLEPKT